MARESSPMASLRLFARDLVCAVLTVPVGMWVTLAQAWTLFRFCPPAPDPEYHSILTSRGLISRPGASVREMTATVTVDEWTRPRRSVLGILWILTGPASRLSEADLGPLKDIDMEGLPRRVSGAGSQLASQPTRSAMRR